MSNKTSDKNVANIEDDVKIVKEFIDYAQGVIDDMEYERPVDVTVYQKDLTSMKHILAEREKKLKEWDVANDSVIAHKFAVMQQQLEQKDKRIQELEAKLEFKEFGDLDNVEFEEYMSQFIPKRDVIETLNKHKFAYEELSKMYNNTHYEDDEIRARDFYVIVTEDRIVQVLTKLLGGEK